MTRQRLCAFFLGTIFWCSTFTSLSAQTFEDNPFKYTESAAKPESITNRGLFDKFNASWVKIRTHDDLRLDARVFEPKTSAFSGKRPAIIFTNSWTLDENEYEVQARRFASKGYIVLSYASRGFGGSDGLVTVAGPNDILDFSTIIDWLEANTRVDVENIGMAGISYGGGLALMAVALEPRIKTAASMSGWGSLEQALYRNDTIQETWINLLLTSGTLTARLDPDILEQVYNMQTRSDIAATRAWAASRSPENYIDLINAKKAPVFIENSFLDALFPPLQIRSLYERLEGPKRLISDEGIHGSASIAGVFGLPSKVWDEVHHWMDHWLVDENIPIQTGISFRTRQETNDFTEFPAVNMRITNANPLNSVKLDTQGRSLVTFNGSKDSGATTGIPILNDLATSVADVPVLKKISDIDRRYAAVFQSGFLAKDLKVRGSPRISFTVLPYAKPMTLVAYLYDVDIWGIGTLVSYSVTSLQDPVAVEKDVVLDLNISSFNLKKGHRLALAIDTVDSLYTSANKNRHSISLAVDPSRLIALPAFD